MQRGSTGAPTEEDSRRKDRQCGAEGGADAETGLPQYYTGLRAAGKLRATQDPASTLDRAEVRVLSPREALEGGAAAESGVIGRKPPKTDQRRGPWRETGTCARCRTANVHCETDPAQLLFGFSLALQNQAKRDERYAVATL